MPKKELDQPNLVARGTTVTDITTRSALHKHMTHATKATTLNLSGISSILLATASSLPLPPPISIPLSMPSAVHLTVNNRPPCFTFSLDCSLVLEQLSHLIGFDGILGSNLNWVLLKWTKFDLEFKKEEVLGEEEWRADLAAMRERDGWI